MNILYITHCDPRCASFGSAQRSHYLWEALKRLGTVYTVYNIGPTEEPVCDEDNRIASICFAPSGYLQLRLFAKLGSIFAPFVWPFRSKRVLALKMPWHGVTFDRVIVRYIGNVALTNAWLFGDVYVDVDDLPSESFDTIRRDRLAPPVGMIGSRLVSRWQRYILGKCRASWIASPYQVSVVSPMCPCHVLPNLPMPPRDGYRVNGCQRHQLMTVGLMSYEPNYEGVDWFLKNVWPLINARFHGLSYKICGSGTPERLRKKWSSLPGVEVMGFVADIDKMYEESLAVIVPIWSGAGTCIKVQEAVVRGRKVFATPFAVRGMSEITVQELGIELASTGEEMASQLSVWMNKDCTERDVTQGEIESAAGTMFSSETFMKSVSEVLNPRSGKLQGSVCKGSV